MKKYNDVMRLIREYAKELYPETLLDNYHRLEKSMADHNASEAKRIADRIRRIKLDLNAREANIDWEGFFEDVTYKVRNDAPIPLADIVTLEQAPPESAANVFHLAEILAADRYGRNGENVRLCKSIYGFTTCTNPCAYGSYGSCLFASREGDDVSIAEKMFGNVTTVQAYLEKIRTAKTNDCSNNLKLITTSHKVDEKVLGVILTTLRKARKDPDFKDFPFCVSLGSVDEKQIVRLKEAGATRINHNLETSYYNAMYLAAVSNGENGGGHERAGAREYAKRLKTLITALENKMSIAARSDAVCASSCWKKTPCR